VDVKQSLSVGEVTARRSALIPHCINNGERLSKVSFPSLSIVCVQGDYAGNASPSQAVSYVAINDTRFVPATLATNFLHCYRRKLTALEGNIFSAVRKNDSSMEHAATVYMSTTISERGTHTHTHTSNRQRRADQRAETERKESIGISDCQSITDAHVQGWNEMPAVDEARGPPCASSLQLAYLLFTAVAASTRETASLWQRGNLIRREHQTDGHALCRLGFTQLLSRAVKPDASWLQAL